MNLLISGCSSTYNKPNTTVTGPDEAEDDDDDVQLIRILLFLTAFTSCTDEVLVATERSGKNCTKVLLCCTLSG